MQVEEERATRAPCEFVMSHSTMPTDLPALYHLTRGAKPFFPNRPEEVDFQFEGGKRFALFEGRGKGDTHGGIRDVAEDSAVKRTHRIRVHVASFELDNGFAVADRREFKPDQTRDRRLRHFAASHSFD